MVTVYSVKSSEMVFNLAGHSQWIMSLDWNFEGEYIVTGYVTNVFGEKFININLLCSQQII